MDVQGELSSESEESGCAVSGTEAPRVAICIAAGDRVSWVTICIAAGDGVSWGRWLEVVDGGVAGWWLHVWLWVVTGWLVVGEAVCLGRVIMPGEARKQQGWLHCWGLLSFICKAWVAQHSAQVTVWHSPWIWLLPYHTWMCHPVLRHDDTSELILQMRIPMAGFGSSWELMLRCHAYNQLLLKRAVHWGDCLAIMFILKKKWKEVVTSNIQESTWVRWT